MESWHHSNITTMKAYLFIYSRLENFDYRLIYAPPQSFLPNPTRMNFASFAREVMNTDNGSNGAIKIPRWSLIRRGNKVLFGVGAYNKDLGDCSSKYENRVVRGFFGFVFNHEKGSLPEEYFTLSFFQNLYSSYIKPLWNTARKDEDKINSISQDIDINIEEGSLHFPLELNTCSTICKVLPEAIVISDAINSALDMNDIEVVLGLNNTKHVTSADLFPFRNISVIGNREEENIPIHPRKPPKPLPINPIEDPTKESEHSYYNKLANCLYVQLKKLQVDVKQFVKYLAKKCGLYIIDQNTQPSTNQTPKNKKNTYTPFQDEMTNSLNKPTQDTIDKEKAKRQNCLAAIRKKLLTSDEAAEVQEARASSTNSQIDNNIEELNNITPENKGNLDIEELKQKSHDA